MKKFFLLASFALASLTIRAQISITSANMPVAGNIIPLLQTSNVNGIDYALTGANYAWDFSSLSPTTTTIDTFLSVLSTPLTYNIAYSNPFDAAHLATVATKTTMPSIPMLNITDTYIFMQNKSAQFSAVGVGATISGVGVPLTYDNADVRYKFPVTYGTADSSDSQYHISLSGFGYYGEKLHRVNHVDGWGTLKLPSGTFDVIRVKSVINYTDTIYADTITYGFNINRVVTEYKWLSTELNVPVLQITNQFGLLTILYDSLHPANYGIPTALNRPKLTLSPNPATDVLTIDIPPQLTQPLILIFDVLGNEMYRQPAAAEQKAMVPVGRLRNGIYFVRLQSAEGNFETKLVKN